MGAANLSETTEVEEDQSNTQISVRQKDPKTCRAMHIEKATTMN